MSETPVDDSSKLQDEFDALNAQISKQGSAIRQLKNDGASADVIDEAVKALKALKISATELSAKLTANEPQFNRKSFDDLIIRKMFVVPSFEIHGGVKGLFDLGPPACGLKVRRQRGRSGHGILILCAFDQCGLKKSLLFRFSGCHD